MVKTKAQKKARRLLTACQIGLLCCGFYASAPHAAQAEDFTFTVPIELHNIHPDLDTLVVDCEVLTVPGIARIGSRRVFIRLVREGDAMGFSGDVVVAFDAAVGLDPSLGRAYSCTLSGLTSSATFSPYISPCRSNPTRPQFDAAPGTECRRIDRGLLPSP